MTEQPAWRARKSLLDIVLGPPLVDGDDHEQVGPAAGIPVFGLDALSSSAYGPEAALTMLLALGSLGIVYLLPITLTIVTLLGIVYFSYRQPSQHTQREVVLTLSLRRISAPEWV